MSVPDKEAQPSSSKPVTKLEKHFEDLRNALTVTCQPFARSIAAADGVRFAKAVNHRCFRSRKAALRAAAMTTPVEPTPP